MYSKITNYTIEEYITETKPYEPYIYQLTSKRRFLYKIFDWLVRCRWFPLKWYCPTETKYKRILLNCESVFQLIREQLEMLIARGYHPTTVLLGMDAMRELDLEMWQQNEFPLFPVVFNRNREKEVLGLRVIMVPHIDGVVVF